MGLKYTFAVDNDAETRISTLPELEPVETVIAANAVFAAVCEPVNEI